MVTAATHARRQSDLPVGSILAMADTSRLTRSSADRAERRRPGSPSRSAPSPRRTAAPRARSPTSARRGARIVLVGEDGGWGDLVAPTYAIAEQAVEKAGHHPPRVLRRRVRGEGEDRAATSGRGWRASRSAARERLTLGVTARSVARRAEQHLDTRVHPLGPVEAHRSSPHREPG